MSNIKSLLQTKKLCYVCGCDGNLHCHHIFYGTANRKKSDEDGMVVYLCPAHHNMSNMGVHFNHQLDTHIKQQAQKIWIEHYSNSESGIEDFINRYGKNFID